MRPPVLHPSLLLTALWWAVASPQVPCVDYSKGHSCGCPENFIPKQQSSDDWTRIVTQTTSEDTDYYYIDDMAFRKMPRIASDDGNTSDTLNLAFWPGGLIFYLIDDSFSQNYRKTILAAINSIQTAVGQQHLEFREASTSSGKICQKSYLYIESVSEKRCVSMIGMQRIGLSKMWLSEKSCTQGIIQHELLHALGRFHEQCRPDRDKYVELMPSEIIATECDNFAKMPTASEESDPTLKLPYDAGSIMHYGSCHFSCRGAHTLLLRKDGASLSERNIVANREKMTALDVQKLRLMYPADSKRPYSDKFCPDCGQQEGCSVGVLILSLILCIVVPSLP